MWYILDGEDNSFSIIHEKNILQAGSVINVEDKVRFMYRGDECHGTVIFKHAYHDKCNEKLKQLTKEDKEAKAKAKSQAIENPKPLPSKRTSHSRNLVLGSASANEDISSKKKKKEVQPKMTEAEKTRQRILKLNKEQSQRVANQMILQKQCSPKIQKSSDSEWTPDPEDDFSQDSIVNLGHFKAGLASSNNDLCRRLLKSRSPSPDNVCRSPSPSRNMSGCSSPRADQNVNSDIAKETGSPSKEELMKQIQLLHEKLNRKKDKATPQATENSGNTKQSKAVNSTDNPTDETLTPDKDTEDLAKSTKDDLERSMEGNSSSFSKAEKSDDIDMPEVDVDKINDDLLGYQLYGNKPHTTEICNNIFCDKDVLKQAIANATNINHLVRRLMTGVFIPSKITNCTVTGQAWHAGGDEKLKEKKDPLHGGALKAIVAFSNSFFKSKKMHTKKFEKCKPIFSGRLNEIKKQVKAGKLKDIEG